MLLLIVMGLTFIVGTIWAIIVQDFGVWTSTILLLLPELIVVSFVQYLLFRVACLIFGKPQREAVESLHTLIKVLPDGTTISGGWAGGSFGQLEYHYYEVDSGSNSISLQSIPARDAEIFEDEEKSPYFAEYKDKPKGFIWWLLDMPGGNIRQEFHIPKNSAKSGFSQSES